MNFELENVMDGDSKPITGHVIDCVNTRALLIHFDGYGERNTIAEFSSPVLIENRDGVPYVVIWGDINQADPTHVISLEGANVKLDMYKEAE